MEQIWIAAGGKVLYDGGRRKLVRKWNLALEATLDYYVGLP